MFVIFVHTFFTNTNNSIMTVYYQQKQFYIYLHLFEILHFNNILFDFKKS